MSKRQLAAWLLLLAGALPADASITNYHRYDSLGRLSAECQWTPSSAQRTEYAFDAASNRSNYRSFATPNGIQTNASITSPDGNYRLVMQSDGNLVLYNTSSSPVWASGTSGTAGRTAAFQSDGNLVIYAADGSSTWNSGTNGHPCSALYVQNDGKVVIYDLDGHVLWATS